MTEEHERAIVRSDGSSSVAPDVALFNPRIVRGLAWLNAESRDQATQTQDPREMYLDLTFLDRQKLGYYCVLDSPPSLDELLSYPIGRSYTQWALKTVSGSLQRYELKGTITFHKSVPLMLFLTDLDLVDECSFELLRQFDELNVCVVDACGCAGPGGPESIWNGATGRITHYLQGYKRLLSLSLGLTGATDEDLSSISSISTLQYLNLNDTAITDQGLSYLSGLSNLRRLDVLTDYITDAGLRFITCLEKLEHLEFPFESPSPKQYEILRTMRNLKYPNVHEAQ